ncbi:MAG: ECF transporter S component [Candidatus Nanopelagicales bacterium]|nr:ECF transporter S component [Candidatus Nanopelagicales bacterium]
MTAATMPQRVQAMRLSRRSFVTLLLVSAAGLLMFLWPLLASPDSQLAHNSNAPMLFAALLAMLLLVMLSEVSSGDIDSKALAMLGVLAAIAAILRPLGAGVTGFQPMFVILILGGRALGPGFGFSLGMVSMFGSALLMGGIGPWLPFQMLGAAWVGLGAGLLPRAKRRAEVVMLAAYGAVAGLMFGLLLNLWFWPFLTNLDSSISFVPGDPLTTNLSRYLVYCAVTSLGFDIPRAIGNVILILVAARPILRSIRRSTRKANFAARPVFIDE